MIMMTTHDIVQGNAMTNQYQLNAISAIVDMFVCMWVLFLYHHSSQDWIVGVVICHNMDYGEHTTPLFPFCSVKSFRISSHTGTHLPHV